MPSPQLTDSQVIWVIGLVAAYIKDQRDIYLRRGVPLDSIQKGALRPFFPNSTLDAIKVTVLSEEHVGNPPFYGDLIRIGFAGNSLPDFRHMAAVTFVDTVVCRQPFADRLLFHELVHVLQYEKLGLEQFAAKYVTGFLSRGSYAAIPLEMNAYELEARFAESPTVPFSVDAEVQLWIDAGRF